MVGIIERDQTNNHRVMQEIDQHTRGLSCGILCEACRSVCSAFIRELEHPGEAVSVLGLPWDPGWKTGSYHTPVRHRMDVAVLIEWEAKKAPSGQKGTQRL